MATQPEILLLSEDRLSRERHTRALGDWANITTDPSLLAAGGAELPELIVTDKLPLTEPLGPAADLVARGEIAVLGVGTQGPSDVVLSADCSERELFLACQLSVEIVRLRRRLAEEKRAKQALRKMAYRDSLTGLANRRRWDQELAARLKALGEAGPAAALGVVLLDLDFFKPLNDRLGHIAGDMTLQRIAQKLLANLAQQHLAARLGGDEFGVLLSGVLPTEVVEVADSVRRSLEHQPDGYGSDVTGDVTPVTASAGVVVVRSEDRIRPLDALRAADRALRAAKQQGRNRTVAGSLGES